MNIKTSNFFFTNLSSSLWIIANVRSAVYVLIPRVQAHFIKAATEHKTGATNHHILIIFPSWWDLFWFLKNAYNRKVSLLRCRCVPRLINPVRVLWNRQKMKRVLSEMAPTVKHSRSHFVRTAFFSLIYTLIKFLFWHRFISLPEMHFILR